MKRDLAVIVPLWAALTGLGEWLVLRFSVLPRLISDKGAELELSFRMLLVYAVPVFCTVVTVLAYMVVRYRSGAGEVPPEDGPPVQGRGAVPLAWLGTTSALALLLIVYPGLTELPKVLNDTRTPDLTVNVEGFQWAWRFSYPRYGRQSSRELVLPVNQMVRFEITSLDVLHGFWIPAFGITMEAVPGQTDTLQYRPTEISAFNDNDLLRVQCSELCGVAHSTMAMPVRIVSEQEFADWIEKQAPVRAQPPPNAQRLTTNG